MPKRELIVIGASAGGIEALQQVLGGLRADLPAAVMVVLHMPPTGGTALERILARATDLTVKVADDGEPLLPGRVYLARGGLHLLVRPGHVHVRPGPRENGHRPAVDPLFRSAANYYDGRAIGVILSGSQSDGTAGLFAIRSRAGLAVVQDPADALYDGMPSSALEYVGVDHVVPAADMGELLTRLVESSPDRDRPEQPFAPHLHREVRFMEGDLEALENDHPGEPSPWPCPDCNGVLWQIEDGPILRFRCRIGHAWAADTLLQQQGDGVEEALWMALRALEDRVALSQKLAARAEEGGRRLSALRYREDLAAMERSVDVLRQLLTTRRTGSEELNEGGNPGG